jgi:hypothetical protein
MPPFRGLKRATFPELRAARSPEYKLRKHQDGRPRISFVEHDRERT